jgi:hypothetical protein
MQFLAENEGSTFSPRGILRVKVETCDLIGAAKNTLEAIRSKPDR